MKTETCFYCGREITDGREVSGWTGPGPDWMEDDGDFGCDANPISGPEGVGSHRTREEVMMMLTIVEESDDPLGGTMVMRERLYGGSR